MMEGVMYIVYLFKEKSTDKVIYVGSSARPAERMKEHNLVIKGSKHSNQRIYDYIRDHGLKLYKDIEVVWVDCADSREEMYDLEATYYFKYKDTVMNDRPAEIRFGKYNPRTRKVRCLNDGRVFSTVTECARAYGKKRTTISNVVTNVKPYTWIDGEKYRFEYVNGTCDGYSERKYASSEVETGDTLF